jgi:hypothetical protein
MKARQISIIAVIIVLAITAICSMSNAAEIIASQNLGQSAYTASSSYSAGFAPYLAFDGNTGTMWNAGRDGGWIEVNLGRVCDLTRISLLCYPPSGTIENYVWYSNSPIGNGYADGLACVLSGTGATYESSLIGIQSQYVQVQTTLPAGWTGFENWVLRTNGGSRPRRCGDHILDRAVLRPR